MNVTVMVPSALKVAVDGRQKLQLGVPPGTGVAEVLQTLLKLYPKLGQYVTNDRPGGTRGSLTVVQRGERVYLFAPTHKPVTLMKARR